MIQKGLSFRTNNFENLLFLLGVCHFKFEYQDQQCNNKLFLS